MDQEDAPEAGEIEEKAEELKGAQEEVEEAENKKGTAPSFPFLSVFVCLRKDIYKFFIRQQQQQQEQQQQQHQQQQQGNKERS